MKLHLTIFTLLILGLAGTSFGQQAKIEGNVSDDGGRLVPPVTIVAIPSGQTRTTDSKGHFTIKLPSHILPGVAARIRVATSGWVILKPLFGECATQDMSINREPLAVVITRPGSPATKNPNQLSALVDRLKKKIGRQGTLINELTSRVNDLEFQQAKTALLQEYADEYGLSADKLKVVLDEWAQNAKVGETIERANQAYWRGDFDEVLRLTEEVGPDSRKGVKQSKNEYLQRSRVEIARLKDRGYIFWGRNDFVKALKEFAEIVRGFDSKDFPKDDFKEDWAEASMWVGNVKSELSEQAEGQESRRLLKEALVEQQQVMTFYTREQTPLDWAWAQNNLGNTLSKLGVQSSGNESRQYLNDGITAYRAALQELTRQRSAQQREVQEWSTMLWAITQSNLGFVLVSLAESEKDEESIKHLNEAIVAHHAALPFVTRKETPRKWAIIQLNLAAAWLALSSRASRVEYIKYLNEAIARYRAALDVLVRDKQLIHYRALAQNGLGAALAQLGGRVKDEESINHINEAITNIRAVLQVFTPEEEPEEWTSAMVNLGAALNDLGERTTGEDSFKYLDEAIKTGRAALKVLTRQSFPQQWVMIQNNLGHTWSILGNRAKGGEKIKYWKEAINAYRTGLEGGTREAWPDQWLLMQKSLANLYFAVQDWASAAEAYSVVFQFNGDEESYVKATMLYHEETLDFEKAFTLNQQWLALHPRDAIEQAESVEKQFTTARFVECLQQINVLLSNPEIPNYYKTILRAIEIASLLVVNQKNKVPGKLDALIAEVSRQPAEYEIGRKFKGTRHFINRYEKLAPHRVWLGQLLDALVSEDRDTMLKALQEVQTKFKERRRL